ncbi:MAG: major capsid protein [Nitrospirae bacterium]|nr:major capsid protein [Nitrospirota bacterium]
MLEIDLRKYFTPKAIAQMLSNLPVIKTPVMDRIYPEAKRKQHQLPVLGINEITQVIKNVPVVRRGTPAIPITGDSQQISYIEPQPVEVSSFLSATEMNNLKLLSDKSIEQFMQDKIDTLRSTVRKTVEALSAQSLTGAISYSMKTSGGFDTYAVTFGSTLEFVLSKLWSAADKTVGEILKDLIEMARLLNEKGYSEIAYLAGSDAYIALANKVLGLPSGSNIKAEVNEKAITIAGFSVEIFNGVYINPTDGSTQNAVPPKKLCAIGLDAPFALYYCAIDDIEAGLVALPFFASPEKKKNPSGIEIVGKSKPLPVPVPNGICWAEVTA